MRILFTSQGHTALVDPDAPVPRYLALDFPAQETWQPAAVFSDGRRLLLLSMEARRDGPGKPFAEYYHHTPTHIWICDLEDDALSEVVIAPRLAAFQTPQLLLDDARMLVQVVRDEGGQIYNVSLDGTDARPITQLGEGLPYGFDLSPDGTRLAYHLASPQGYQIWTSDPFGQQRQLVAAHDDWLFFGPKWSPDGALIASCRTPGARVPWTYQPQRPDVDHFNRDFVPEQARGGAQIRRLISTAAPARR